MNIYYLLLILIIIIYFIYTFYKLTEGVKGERKSRRVRNRGETDINCGIESSKIILTNINNLANIQNSELTKPQLKKYWKDLSKYANNKYIKIFKLMYNQVLKKYEKKQRPNAKKEYKIMYKNLYKIVKKCNVRGKKFRKLFEPALKEM
tara:strand:+ start:929 stop:1375 length:447 start_codon:yes stop_codon:yes gene_type:complete